MRRARSQEEVDAALELRREVFCVEQGVSLAADRDGRDDEAEQIVAILGGSVVGTCRLLIEHGVSRLGRMVVSSGTRGRGVGGRLLREADRVTARLGIDRIVLHAQVPARHVYDRAGYRVSGPAFVEEGIEHVPMEKRLA